MAPDANKAKRAASGIFTLIDTVPNVDAYSEEGKIPAGTGNISFQKIEFAYPCKRIATLE